MSGEFSVLWRDTRGGRCQEVGDLTKCDDFLPKEKGFNRDRSFVVFWILLNFCSFFTKPPTVWEKGFSPFVRDCVTYVRSARGVQKWNSWHMGSKEDGRQVSIECVF